MLRALVSFKPLSVVRRALAQCSGTNHIMDDIDAAFAAERSAVGSEAVDAAFIAQWAAAPAARAEAM